MKMFRSVQKDSGPNATATWEWDGSTAESRHFNALPMDECDIGLNTGAIQSCSPGPGCEVYTRLWKLPQ